VVLQGIPGVPDGTALTACRQTKEVGIPELEGRLRFATYGEPAFEAVLDHVAEYGLPPGVRRLEVPVPGTPATLVAYAASVQEGDGAVGVRLLTRLEDLRHLSLAEGHPLGDEALEPLIQELARLAEAEAGWSPGVPNIEELNEKTARSHRALAWMLARGLLLDRQALGKGLPLFWREAAAIEQDYADRAYLRVTRIEKRWALRLVHPLYEPKLPQVGETGYLDAPRPLFLCAIASACRVADAMRVKKAELRTDDLVARLEREIERELAGR